MVACAAVASVLGAADMSIALAASQAPAQRSGRSAAGVPFALHGRTLRITVPASTRRGRKISVSCGRLTTADMPPGASPRRVMARGSRVFRGQRRLRIRLDRDVSALAEWCEFATQPSGRYGAAVLKPRLAPAPAPLVSGPGVREAIVDGARFLLDGATLTLIAERPLRGDVVLFLACYATSPTAGLEATGARSVAIGSGRRKVTVDLGVDIEAAATMCFAESSREGDLFLAQFGTAPRLLGRPAALTTLRASQRLRGASRGFAEAVR